MGGFLFGGGEENLSLFAFVAFEDLARQVEVVLSALAGGVVADGSLTMAWSLGEADVAGNEGLEYHVLKVAFYLIENLIG